MALPNPTAVETAPTPEIRQYRPEDRAEIHQIAYDTGMMGSSIVSQWRNFESWAEVNTGYYLDHEPESVLVASLGNRVTGYLLGCVDSGRVASQGADGAKAVFRHGLLFRPGTAGFLWRLVGDSINDKLHGRLDLSSLEFKDTRWPAHFHINFSQEFRGLGLGSIMVQKWLDRLRELEVPGCYLQTLTEGVPTPTMAFLARQGFRTYGEPALVPGYRSAAGSRLYNQVMVQEIDPAEVYQLDQ